MANIKSSLKDIRRITKRTEHNRRLKSRLKTLRKQADVALAGGGDGKDAARRYISALDKAAKTGVIHANKARRHKSIYMGRAAAS